MNVAPPPEVRLTPVAVLTDDDHLINLLGSRRFVHDLCDAGLTVVVATSVAQAAALKAMPLVVTAEFAHVIGQLDLGARKVTGVCTAFASQTGGPVRWVPWPTSPGGWLELLALASVQSTFATTSQMLAARKKAAA